MTYILGVIHPRGENFDYDGLFLKENEFNKIAAELVDKPLLFNHDHSCQIGKVVSVWPGKGKDNETELFALCEIYNDSLQGNIASHAVDKKILKDFSLGHQIKVEQSINSRKIIEKNAVEVSICQQGARENTHIYAISFDQNRKKKYINTFASSSHSSLTNMSNEAPTAETPAEETHPAAETPAAQEEPIQLTHSVLQQLKSLQQQKIDLENELHKYKESSKKERLQALNNGVNDYIAQLLEKNPELAAYKDEIDQLSKRMIESESATPLVKLLQAAASRSSSSVVELEKAYQEQKKKDEVIARLKKDLKTFQDDAFASPTQRMTTLSAVASAEPSSKKQKTNGLSNDLFAEIDNALKNTAGSTSVPVFNVKLNENRYKELI
jgi:protein-arginine kinase activator protein McsA